MAFAEIGDGAAGCGKKFCQGVTELFAGVIENFLFGQA